MNFRYDINGLRAIAVIAVVLFHFNPAWVPGGFAGVDVFFVISGFLMTSIIFRGLENDNFNLFKFYVARANRIIPALAVLCLILLVFGWFYLTPLDYRALGKHVASSMGFLSNIIYWRESGYFDAASHEKWLLHTWSLSVEWQFYIIYPIVLVALKKFLSLENLKRLIAIGTVLGFCLSIIATMKWPNPAYYLLPTRAWEMMMGGVAFLYPWSLSKNQKKVTEIIGLTLILGSYAFVSSDVPWPGHLALFPVIGAYLILISNRQNSLITNNKFFQYLGKWSYSIYLWHWPLVVFLGMSIFQDHVGLFLVLSVLLGWASYELVESFKFKTTQNIFHCQPVYFSIFMFLLASVIWKMDGENSNLTKLKDIEEQIAYPYMCHVDDKNIEDYESYIDCKLSYGGFKVKGLLWGDSYAGHLDPLVHNLVEGKADVTSRSTSHCFPALNLSNMLGSPITSKYCSLIRSRTIDELSSGYYDFVFMAGRWESMYEEHGDLAIDELFKAIKLASENSKLVFVFSQPIYYQNRVANVFSRHLVSPVFSGVLTRDDELANAVNYKIKSNINSYNFDNVVFLDRKTLYGNVTPQDYTNDGLPYTYDNGHLNVHGSLSFAENLKSSDSFSKFEELFN